MYKEPSSAYSITKQTGFSQAPYNLTIFGWDTLESCLTSTANAFFSASVSIDFTATSTPFHCAL